MRAAVARSFALALIAAIVGCSEPAPTREWTPADHGQPATPDEASIPQTEPSAPDEDPDARAARALWNATCAGCHGRDGRGMGEARPPAAQIPDFTTAEWQANRTDEALAQAIAEGRGMMPPFGKQINPQGLAALVRHIRRYAPAGTK